jgi:general secretion pathway protein C
VAIGSDGSKVVRKTGPGSYTLHRSGVAALMSDLGQVARMARGIASYQDGKTTGFKLVGVRPGSVLGAMGIRSGDIVRSVNGTVMDSPAAAMGVMALLRTADVLTLRIERRGKERVLTYSQE